MRGWTLNRWSWDALQVRPTCQMFRFALVIGISVILWLFLNVRHKEVGTSSCSSTWFGAISMEYRNCFRSLWLTHFWDLILPVILKNKWNSSQGNFIDFFTILLESDWFSQSKDLSDFYCYRFRTISTFFKQRIEIFVRNFKK